MNVRTLLLPLLATFVFTCLCAADDWPQWRGSNRDGVWNETGLIEEFDCSEIKHKWKAPIGSGYCGPTVADERVFVADRVVEPREIERVHCFDWQTGEKMWSHSYDCEYDGFGYRAGPRASVLIDEGRAYSLGSTGQLYCFDAAKGAVLWNLDLFAKYKIRMPNWGIAASPIVEDDLVVVQIGGTNACIVAFDKSTGEEKWTSQGDAASYSAPIIIDQAGKRVLVCATGDRLLGLDITDGKLLWEYPWAWEKWPIIISTPVLHKDLLMFCEAHKGTIILRVLQNETKVEKVWHRRRGKPEDGPALHCLNSTPMIRGEHIYGADSNGVLRCLRLDNGDQMWEDRTAVPIDKFSTIHLVINGERTWMFNERGELIIARLTPDGFDEISRAKLIEPTREQMRRPGGVTWSHPAFAYRHVFARNDKELVCADLSAEP